MAICRGLGMILIKKIGFIGESDPAGNVILIWRQIFCIQFLSRNLFIGSLISTGSINMHVVDL